MTDAAARRNRNLALELTAQECMRVLELLRRMKHRAEAHCLSLAIPAELDYLQLMSECARLKHVEPATDAEHP